VRSERAFDSGLYADRERFALAADQEEWELLTTPERWFKVLYLAPAANLAVGLLDLACGARTAGVANLVGSVIAVGAITFLEADGKIDIRQNVLAHAGISPQDRAFRDIHEYL
jgi:hypothetical protein